MSVDLDEQGGVRLGGAAQFRIREHALTATLLGRGDRLDVEELEHRGIHAQGDQIDGGFERRFVRAEGQQERPAGGG